MTQPTITTPRNGTGSGSQPLPAILRERDKDRLNQYRAALGFYDGKQWPGVRRPTRLRRLTFNYTRTITNKTASYVMKGATVGVHPLSESEDAQIAAAEAELALGDISQANALPRLDYTTEIDTSVLGDGAFKLAWDPQDEVVAITAPDMAGIFPWPHPTDPSRFRRVAHRYQLPAADVMALWGINPKKDPTDIIEDWTDQALDIYIDDAPAPRLSLANPYGLIPFVIFPNQQVPKRWWGQSDITPVIEIAQELNAQYSRISNILELSGNPITILENVEQESNIETYPGAVWTLPPDSRAYLLDLLQTGATRIHLEYLDAVQRAFHDISETPRAAFGSTERDLSGVALQVELEPLLQKVSRKRLIRTDAYTVRAAMALRILDQFTGTNHAQAGAITVAWDAPTPSDHSRFVADERIQVEAGLSSRRTAMARLTVQDPDTEWDRWLEEQKSIGEFATPAKTS